VVATLLTYALVYRWGMRVYEDQSVLFIQALQVVIEAVTTAGFGSHAPWSSPQMSAMVLFMNLTGVLFVFLALPLFAVPLLRDAFERRPPDTFSGTDHIVLTPHTTRVETLIARDASPDAHIVARANEEENERKIYRAGADYVQSLATISGRMMAETILADEDVLSFQMKIDVVRLEAGRLAGQTLAEADVRAETGCTVVVAVRDGDLGTT
jgi:voltage-gated potassium channel Kch